MKKFPIALGVDDASFNYYSEQKTTQLIGVVCQGTRMVAVHRREINIDGINSTEKLIEIIKQNEKHVMYVLTDSITFGGFNIYDMKEVYSATQKPLIAVSEQEVDLNAVKNALEKKYNRETYLNKLRKILHAGNLYRAVIETAGGRTNVFYHCIGIETSDVEELLRILCIDSKLPEPIRMAHMIGRIF
ncbi:MAG: endonuclease dU [Promethearchaeota archaeon]